MIIKAKIGYMVFFSLEENGQSHNVTEKKFYKIGRVYYDADTGEPADIKSYGKCMFKSEFDETDISVSINTKAQED